MRIIPELPPLPPPPPFLELPTLPNPPAIPELSPLPQLSVVPSLRAFFASTEDTEEAEELPPMSVIWMTPETETIAECPQPPHQSMPHTPEEEIFDILIWRLSAQLNVCCALKS
jgi:hypothetical protein